MINCPKCNELIGDNVAECPFCKCTISEEARKEAILNNERLHERAVSNSMLEYGKRTKIAIIVSIIMLLVAILGMILIATYDLSVVYGIILFAIVFMFYGFSVYKFHIGLCPYCESFMGRGPLFRTHCPRCGGRLR